MVESIKEKNKKIKRKTCKNISFAVTIYITLPELEEENTKPDLKYDSTSHNKKYMESKKRSKR